MKAKDGSDKMFILEASDISRILLSKPAHKFDHKGIRGTALIVAGSYGKHGAAVLAAKGALKAGVGKLYMHVPRTGVEILQTLVPEALVDIDDNTEVPTVVKDAELYTAIGVGPGIGTSALTRDLIAKLFAGNPKNLVLDADALNILATDKELWTRLPEGSILTPHIKEFTRLYPEEIINESDRLEKLSAMAVEKKSIIILKGADSAIALPSGEICFNSTGNPGMAKSGMGDVLTGMITTFLARGFTNIEAAKLGVYLHGMAGDFALKDIGLDALSPLDLIKKIGTVLESFRQ